MNSAPFVSWHHSVRGRSSRPAVHLLRSLLACVLILSILLPGLAIPSVIAQDTEPHNVPMFRGNPARTGQMPGPGPKDAKNIESRWGMIASGAVSSSPAVVDGVVMWAATMATSTHWSMTGRIAGSSRPGKASAPPRQWSTELFM